MRYNKLGTATCNPTSLLCSRARFFQLKAVRVIVSPLNASTECSVKCYLWGIPEWAVSLNIVEGC